MVFCLWLIFILLGWLLRKLAIAQIVELTGAKIEAKSVDFNFDGSVFIKGLVVTPYQKPEYYRDSPFAKKMQDEDLDVILKAETVYARFNVGSVLLLRPRLKEINVKNFVFNALHDLDTGWWNIDSLKISAPKGGSGKMPVVHLEGGKLQYSKISEGQAKVAAEVPLDAEFGPTEENLDAYSFKIATAKWSHFGKSTLTGFWQPGRIAITGGISSADIPAFERAWTISVIAGQLEYDRSNAYSLKLRIRDLYSKDRFEADKYVFESRPFLQKFGSFDALQRFFNQYRPAGQIDIDLDASGSLDRLGESKLQGRLYCKDVSICYHKFKYPIEHLTGQIDFTERSVLLNNLHGLHNDVELVFNGWSSDFGPDCRYQIQMTSDNMVLDDDLYNALSTERRKFWSIFSPSGLAAINYSHSQRSQTDKKSILAVELLGVEAVCRYFPYPLKSLTGILLFDQDGITVSDLVSQSDEGKITLNGKITACGTDRPIYDITVKAQDIPLDSTLEQALPTNQRYLYNRFDMTGLADGDIKIFTPQQGTSHVSFIADLFFKNAALKVPVAQTNSVSQESRKRDTQGSRTLGIRKTNKSSMTLCDISANAVFTPDLIRIESFNGRHNQGLVSMTGRMWQGREAEQLCYYLSLDAKQMPLNDEVLGLLPTALRKNVSKLQPAGKIDCHLDLNKLSSQEPLDYRATIDRLDGSINFESFPYPLKDITGSITVTKDNIRLENVTARPAVDLQIAPNTSTIKINGQIDLTDNVFSSGSLRLDANDIFLDEQFGIAVPKNMQDFYFKLSPAGRFDLRDVNVKIVNTQTGKKHIHFAGDARLKDCNLNLWLAAIEFNAILNQLEGSYKTADGFCNIQSTITADCYDGRLAGKFELKQLSEPALEYLLQIGFDNIDLKQFLKDHKHTSSHLKNLSNTKTRETHHGGYTTGKMAGSLSVAGQTGDTHSRIGRCRLLITDMQVGKLSPLAKLLQVLKLTEPKDFAFDQMLVDSYIKRDKLFFEKFDLSGQAVAFNGSGWMDLQNQNIDLTLTARGQRLATAEPSVLQSLTEGLGQAVVRMEVTGTLYEPQVTTTTLPVIKQTLEILGTRQTKPD